jgi:hypothetical protein
MQRNVAGMCDAHPFDRAVGQCASCRRAYCEDCLVDPHLVTKEIFCIPCAVSAAGVRSTARRPARAAAATGRVGMSVVVLTGLVGAAASAAVIFI